MSQHTVKNEATIMFCRSKLTWTESCRPWAVRLHFLLYSTTVMTAVVHFAGYCITISDSMNHDRQPEGHLAPAFSASCHFFFFIAIRSRWTQNVASEVKTHFISNYCRISISETRFSYFRILSWKQYADLNLHDDDCAVSVLAANTKNSSSEIVFMLLYIIPLLLKRTQMI